MSASVIKEFETRTEAFIKANKLLHRGAPVVVALSGGADSVALLSVLSALGYDCRAAHCNFHLRGAESMRDMRHAADVCRQLAVDLYVKDFDMDIERAGTGESVEMACRRVRYAWFGDLLDREGAQATAVGHHSEDRAETFMLNLLRGTGIAGLTSMRPRHDSVVRPLLPVTRSQIEQYLVARGLKWVDDSSNGSDVHRRNRLRNHIFPLVEQLFPGATGAIIATIANLESTADIYRSAVAGMIAPYIGSNGDIMLRQLAAAQSHADTVLFEYLRPYGFGYGQVCDMLRGAESSGQRYVAADNGTVTAEQSYGILHISRAGADAAGDTAGSIDVDLRHDIVTPVHISVSRRPAAAFRPENIGPDVAYIDAAAAGPAAVWQLRHWRRGDRMVPFGSNKSKLLSDIMANARIDAPQRRNVWLLTRNDEIVWAVGVRNSALFSVGPDTKEYLRLQLNEKP